jgi:hypothetical protein
LVSVFAAVAQASPHALVGRFAKHNACLQDFADAVKALQFAGKFRRGELAVHLAGEDQIIITLLIL